ncbi:MAG: membrane protein insertase YidC [Bifidobacteriaceae bacterium]|jgi:YidC/Oxa1 family membrane protein insertase|nr:membrane protein insertase YidC [Bifidobacteriaceae bacterium]
MDWFDTILSPIMWVVAWIMYGTHQFWAFLGLGKSLSWVLAIVVLVVIMRIIMIPLFVKQIRSSRGMQLLQPELQKIQRRYKGKTDAVSRRRMQEETMELYRRNGSNPMSGCWPVLAQSPLFFALFRVLYSLRQLAEGEYPRGDSIGPIDQTVAIDIQSTYLFGAPLSATFLDEKTWAGASPVAVRVVTVILIILMSVTTFTTQRQLTMKNMPQTAMDNPMFRTQKMMMYMMPVIFAVSGVNFQIGVLIYWFTTNVWSMGQQFFVIRNMPAPGSEAEARMKARKEKKRLRKGLGLEGEEEPDAAPSDSAGPAQRAQPKRTSRAQRRSGPLQAANPSPRPEDSRREIEPADAEPAEPGSKTGQAKSGRAGGKDQAKPAGRDSGAGGGTASSSGSGGSGGSAGSGGTGRAAGQRSQPKKQSRKKRK